MLYLVENNAPVAWTGQRIGGIAYPLDIEAKWTESSLNSIGLHFPVAHDPIPTGYTKTGDTATWDGAQVKMVATTRGPDNDDVNAERERRIQVGKTFAVTGGLNIRVAGDDQTKTNLANLALAAQVRIGQGDLVTQRAYRDEDNVIHDLTPLQMLELWSLAATYVSDIYEASWSLKDDPNGIPADYADDARWPA